MSFNIIDYSNYKEDTAAKVSFTETALMNGASPAKLVLANPDQVDIIDMAAGRVINQIAKHVQDGPLDLTSVIDFPQQEEGIASEGTSIRLLEQIRCLIEQKLLQADLPCPKGFPVSPSYLNDLQAMLEEERIQDLEEEKELIKVWTTYMWRMLARLDNPQGLVIPAIDASVEDILAFLENPAFASLQNGLAKALDEYFSDPDDDISGGEKLDLDGYDFDGTYNEESDRQVNRSVINYQSDEECNSWQSTSYFDYVPEYENQEVLLQKEAEETIQNGPTDLDNDSYDYNSDEKYYSGPYSDFEKKILLESDDNFEARRLIRTLREACENGPFDRINTSHILPTSAIHLFDQLLELFDGVAIGEGHTHQASKRFLVENMSDLKSQGVNKIYAEWFCREDQRDLDHFFNTGEVTCFLQQALDTIDSQKAIHDNDDTGQKVFQYPFNSKGILDKAREHGIRIIAIDTEEARRDLCHAFMDVDYSRRMILMNSFAVKTIQKKQNKQAGKFLAIMGTNHLYNFEGMPGIAEMVKVPSVVIIDKDEPYICNYGSGILGDRKASSIFSYINDPGMNATFNFVFSDKEF